VSRTNIDIDDELVERAMRMYRLESKRAAVQLALEKLVGERMSTEEILAMQGVGYPVDNDELEGTDEPVDLAGVDPGGRPR
jgi:Arc/MetJ family transcription regulator